MARTARRAEKAKKPVVRPLADERVLAVVAQIEDRRVNVSR
jgi:hypothetical protein